MFRRRLSPFSSDFCSAQDVVRCQTKQGKDKCRFEQEDHKTLMVISYVLCLWEAVARVYKRHGICTTSSKSIQKIWNLHNSGSSHYHHESIVPCKRQSQQ